MVVSWWVDSGFSAQSETPISAVVTVINPLIRVVYTLSETFDIRHTPVTLHSAVVRV